MLDVDATSFHVVDGALWKLRNPVHLAWCMVKLVDRLDSMHDLGLVDFFVDDRLDTFVNMMDSMLACDSWEVR